MSIIEKLMGRDRQVAVVPDENRPIKFVPDGHNSWRVVYAD